MSALTSTFSVRLPKIIKILITGPIIIFDVRKFYTIAYTGIDLMSRMTKIRSVITPTTSTTKPLSLLLKMINRPTSLHVSVETTLTFSIFSGVNVTISSTNKTWCHNRATIISTIETFGTYVPSYVYIVSIVNIQNCLFRT